MEAKELGVPVKMLTGDAVAIAVETSKMLGLGSNIYNSQTLISGEGMSGSDVHDFVEAADGFGEVFPCVWLSSVAFEINLRPVQRAQVSCVHFRLARQGSHSGLTHRTEVVQYLQDRGHLCAMTGDGVNDAPSLKLADCGIAVEGASDAARAAADVVFLDEGLSTIVLGASATV